MRHPAVMLCTVLLLAAAPSAGAMTASWHDSGHPQSAALPAIARAPEVATSPNAISVVSGAIGDVFNVAVRCREAREGKGPMRFVAGAASCVLRTGVLMTRGVPLPRAAAGVALDELVRIVRGGEDSDEGGEVADEGDGLPDSERTR